MLGHKDVMKSSCVCTHTQKPYNMAATNAFQAEEHEYCCHHGETFLFGEQLLVKYQYHTKYDNLLHIKPVQALLCTSK